MMKLFPNVNVSRVLANSKLESRYWYQWNENVDENI